MKTRPLSHFGSPEADLLVALSVPSVGEAKIREILRRPQLNLDEAYRLANRHGMVGLVTPALLQMVDGKLPSVWKERWRELAFQDLSQLAALEEILSAASKRGITVLLLKGLSIHLQAYASEETARGAGDIDLMVRPSQVSMMKECLEGLGFVFRGTDSWSRPVSSWTNFIARDSEALFQKSDPTVAIDLHWRLCAPGLERACGITLSQRIGQRTRTIRVGGVSCAIPGREEEVLFLCLHLFKGGTFVLRNLSDAAWLIQASPPIDWDLFLRIGKETGMVSCAYYAMRLVHQLSPGIVPDAVNPPLRRAAGPSWVLAQSLKIDRLLRTRGEGLSDLSTFWNGVLFARHPARWLPYQTVRVGRWMARRVEAVLR